MVWRGTGRSLLLKPGGVARPERHLGDVEAVLEGAGAVPLPQQHLVAGHDPPAAATDGLIIWCIAKMHFCWLPVANPIGT